jgi:hypothetical protein
VRTHDFEASVVGVELVADDEGNDGGFVAGEEVLASLLEFPVLGFKNLLELGCFEDF